MNHGYIIYFQTSNRWLISFAWNTSTSHCHKNVVKLPGWASSSINHSLPTFWIKRFKFDKFIFYSLVFSFYQMYFFKRFLFCTGKDSFPLNSTNRIILHAVGKQIVPIFSWIVMIIISLQIEQNFCSYHLLLVTIFSCFLLLSMSLVVLEAVCILTHIKAVN